jgi:hypothetical protein
VRGSAAIAALVAVGALAAPAAAEPCSVQMVRVPDDVRVQIERWVSAEPSCRVQLAVRVLPTEGGLYVIATDGAGLVRERLVPDATTAAVLIASWVADDGAARRPAPAPSPTPTPAPVERTPAPAPAPVTPVFAQDNPPVRPAWAQAHPPVKPSWAATPAGPGTVAPTAPVDQPAPRAVDAPGFRRLVGFGLSMHEKGGGLRGEIDMLKKWRMRLGVIAAWSHTSYEGYDSFALDDVLVAAFAGNELRFGRIDLRATIGAGFAITTATMNSGESQSLVSPYFDATISAGVAVTRRFEIRAGLDVAYLPQRVDSSEWFHDRDVMPQAIVALGYRGD